MSGTDIIFVVNYIISMWLKYSFNPTETNSIQNSRGERTPQANSRGLDISGGLVIFDWLTHDISDVKWRPP